MYMAAKPVMNVLGKNSAALYCPLIY